MRAVPVLVAAICVSVSGCGVKSVTRQDRVAASIAASKMEDGTILTAAEIDMLDQDQTYECHKEMRVGSHIPKLTCRSLRRIAMDEQQWQTLKLKMTTTSTLGPGSARENVGAGGGD
jgi:hypothetical protein